MAGAPRGRTFHVALESNGLIQVFDIWNSQEELKHLERPSCRSTLNSVSN